jgi:phosphatidylinositol alpha-1,6-mannosyltransferase
MVRRKGQVALVQAWPDVLRSHPDAVLLLVGDGPDRGRLGRLVHRLDLARSVLFTGSVPWHDVPAHTDAGDVFAMPCRTRRWGLEPEAWGIVLLEAQACGLPVVVGRSGGAPEAVADNDRARVVGGQDELVTAVVELLDELRDRGPGDAVVTWTWDGCARALDRIWDAPRPGSVPEVVGEQA